MNRIFAFEAGCDEESHHGNHERLQVGIDQDPSAVRATFNSPWSSGQAEGQVNRLKFLKQQMYGPAKLDWLRMPSSGIRTDRWCHMKRGRTAKLLRSTTAMELDLCYLNPRAASTIRVNTLAQPDARLDAWGIELATEPLSQIDATRRRMGEPAQ
jgi:hypothetical protein